MQSVGWKPAATLRDGRPCRLPSGRIQSPCGGGRSRQEVCHSLLTPKIGRPTRIPLPNAKAFFGHGFRRCARGECDRSSRSSRCWRSPVARSLQSDPRRSQWNSSKQEVNRNHAPSGENAMSRRDTKSASSNARRSMTQQIRSVCREIQASWRPEERAARAGVSLSDRVQFVPPELRFLAAILDVPAPRLALRTINNDRAA